MLLFCLRIVYYNYLWTTCSTLKDVYMSYEIWLVVRYESLRKDLKGVQFMLRDNLHINQHFRDAVIFVFVSAFLIGGLTISQANTLETQDAYDGIPAEVIAEADSLAYREWEYVSQTFPERKYCEYKLEAINHVLTCPHVEGEVIEVYGITCSYRRDNSREWENAVNAPTAFSFFVPKQIIL